MNDEYALDADRIYTYEGHSALVSLIPAHDNAKPEGPSLPFGFVRHRELATTREQLPEPWMWWH